MKNALRCLASIIVCELVGIGSTLFTVASIPAWYGTLNKPFFSPPNWLFGPVWTLLYALMGISAYLIWKEGIQKKKVGIALTYFAAQLVFNFLWSVLFFGLHNPLIAFVDIIVMLVTIIYTMVHFARISKTAMYLLIPYVLWVSFASLLNLSIVLLNP